MLKLKWLLTRFLNSLSLFCTAIAGGLGEDLICLLGNVALARSHSRSVAGGLDLETRPSDIHGGALPSAVMISSKSVVH